MISIKSTVKDIIENPEALAVVKELMPGFDETNPGMKEAYGMSLKALLEFPATQCPKALQQEIADALEDAEIE